MKNKKGFTLIELLAVIVILAIIALIATPIILNMIENAKKGAAKDSAYGYIEAIEYNNSMSDLGLNNGYTKISGEKLDVTKLDVKVKGSKPESGEVTIDKSGRVTSADLCINNYKVTYNGQTATTGDKCGATEEEKEDEVVVLTGDPILDKAKSLVYKDGQCKIDADSTDTTTYKYMGGCYIKGNSDNNAATTNNYIWYNGFMWRIMGINSDDTVRLITDEAVTILQYGEAQYITPNTYEGFEYYIHHWLNEIDGKENTGIFYKSLNDTKSIIQKGNYFCSEPSASSSRANATCTSGKEISAKVGMISADEYNLSGGYYSYLNIGQYLWTMTPQESDFTVWTISAYNGISGSGQGNVYGVRPVINVAKDAIVTSGSGTTSQYYVLAEDKSKDKTGKIGEIVTSGEYVKLEGNVYRVISKNNEGVKLILEGYVGQGKVETFDKTTGIGLTLNDETDSTSVISTLGLSGSNKLVETTWYQADVAIGNGFKYVDILNSKNNPVKAKVGLINMGEMLSAQSATLLTNRYSEAYDYQNASSYVTMNKYYIYERSKIEGTGNASIRPVIVVRNDLAVTGGTGTWNNEYQI